MKHKANAKRLLSSLLVVCMCLSFIPVRAEASQPHQFTLTTDQETGLAIADHDCSAGGGQSTVLFTGTPASTTEDGHVTVSCSACGLEEDFDIPMVTEDFFDLELGARATGEYNGSTQQVEAVVADGSVSAGGQVEFQYSDLVAEGLLEAPEDEILNAGSYSFTYASPTTQTEYEDSEKFFLFVESDGYSPVTYNVEPMVVDLTVPYGKDNPILYEDDLINEIAKPTFTNALGETEEAETFFYYADYEESGGSYEFVDIDTSDPENDALTRITDAGIYTAYFRPSSEAASDGQTYNYVFRYNGQEAESFTEEVYILPSELLPIYVNDELSELEYLPYFSDNKWAKSTWRIVLESEDGENENSTAAAGTYPAILYAYRTDHDDGLRIPLSEGDLDLTVKKRTLLGASSDVYFVGTIGDSLADLGLNASLSVKATVSAVTHYDNPIGSKQILCPVDWDFSTYDSQCPYYQTVYGDLMISESWFDLSDEVENPNNIRANAVIFLMSEERAKDTPPDPEASHIYSQRITLVDENPDYDDSLTGDAFLTQEIERVEYGLYVGYYEDENDTDFWHWQSSPTFTGLECNTTYQFVTRYAQDPFTALPGEARSNIVEITTLSEDQALQGPTVELVASETSVAYGDMIVLRAIAEHPEAEALTFTYSWFTGEGVPLLKYKSDTVILSEISESGTYYCIVGVSNGGDIATGRSNDVTVEITKADPLGENNMPTASSIQYGQTLASSTITPGLLPVGGTFTWVDDLVMPSVAESKTETYQALFTPKDTEHYNSQIIELSVEVTPAPLTIKATDQTKTYGYDIDGSISVPESEVTCSGFVNMENIYSLDGDLVITVQRDDSSSYCPAGSYALIPSGVTSENYDITFENGTLTVEKAPLTVKAKDVTHTYGFELSDELVLPNDQVSCTGLIGTDTFADLGGSLIMTHDGPADGLCPVGSYAITPSGLTSGNYDITFEPGTMKVEPAQVLVKIPDGLSITYGDDVPDFSAGLTSGAGPAVLTATDAVLAAMEADGYQITITLEGATTDPLNAGTYRYAVTSPENPNYNVTTEGAQVFTVTPKEVPVVWEELGTWYYDGKDHSDQIQASFMDIFGEKQLLTVKFQKKDGSSTAPEGDPFVEAGSYLATASTADTNYSLLNATKDYAIAEKDQVADVEFPTAVGSYEYGTPLSEVLLEGGDTDLGTFAWGDPAGYVGSEAFSMRVDSEVPVGSEYKVAANTIVFTPTDKSADYSGVEGYNPATGTISRYVDINFERREIIDMDKVEILTKKTYDGTTAAAVLASDAVRIMDGDYVEVAVNANFEQSDVGTGLQVTVSMEITGQESNLYKIPDTGLDLGAVGEITPAPLIANVSDATVYYGQNVNDVLKNCSVTLNGLMGDDTFEDVFTGDLIYSTSYEALDDILDDTVPITAVGTEAGNYDVSFVDGQLTVLPTQLTIDVANVSMRVGDSEPLPEIDWSASGKYVIGFEQAVENWIAKNLRVFHTGNTSMEGEYPYQITVIPGNENFTVKEGSIGKLIVGPSAGTEPETRVDVHWSGLDQAYYADGTDQSSSITAVAYTSDLAVPVDVKVVFYLNGEEAAFQEPGTYTVVAYEVLEDGSMSTERLTNNEVTVVMHEPLEEPDPEPELKQAVDLDAAVVAAEKVYDGTTEVDVDWSHVELVEPSFFERGNTITYEASYDAASAGSRTITLTARVQGPDAEEYISYAEKTIPGTIQKAVLDVTLDNITVTYGEPVRAGGYKITGFVGGEDESVLSGSLEFDILYGYRQGMDVPASGTANLIIQSFDAEADNYEFAYNVSRIYIKKAPVVVNWDYAADYVETGADQSGSVMASFLDISGERISLPLSFYLDGVEMDGFTNAGHYTVVADTSAYEGNYQFSRASQSIIMNKEDTPEDEPLGFTLDYLDETFYPDNEDQHRFSTDPTFADADQEIHAGDSIQPGMVLYGILARELEAGDLSNVQQYTLPTRSSAPVVSIDFQNEMLLTSDGMEYMGEFGWTSCNGKMPVYDLLGQDMEVRYEATASSFASESARIEIPNRPAAPSGLTKTDGLDGEPGSIGGLTTDMEYSPNNGGSWLPVTDASIPVTPGMYLVRYAASDESFSSSAAAVVIQALVTEPEDPSDPEDPEDPDDPVEPDDPSDPADPDPDPDDSDKKGPNKASGNGLHSDGSDRWPENPMIGGSGEENTGINYVAGYYDVSEEDWFFDAVNFVAANQWMVGYDSNAWSPDKEMSRSMFITVLYRLAGSPTGYGVDQFQDVSKDSWYYNAVAWAYATGITNGTSATTFSPNEAMTYQEMAVFIKNFCDYYNMTMTAGSENTKVDQTQVSDYAKDAVTAVSGTGIMNTNGNTSINAHGTMTRAEAAQIMMNFCYGFYGQFGSQISMVLI